ncbi:protocadherin-23-like isoform X2 [Biomphalaria glabrata]|uniref:Protocadherin-23-like isoform X2 n=1 Tax=Biomphalaria glabrata TaxID=6526 RepID=A0A9U8ECW3_BIOGL|nr:protocadherin-23-like isoform X2 [Biomphalaria glabrata]
MDLKLKPGCVVALVVVLLGYDVWAASLNLTNLPFTIYVKENETVGNVIFNSTYSKPTGTTPIFIINVGNTLRRFSMDAQSGSIYLGGSLDYEFVKQYLLYVRVTNADVSTDFEEKLLTVNVNDTNDNAPVCHPYSVLGELDETAAAGTVFVTLNCTDDDTGDGGVVEYKVISGNSTVIAVNSSNGRATLINQTDYDTTRQDFYSVTVEVSDKGSPRLTTQAMVFLSFKDADDNKPLFTETVFTKEIPENTPVGATALTINATDLDTPNTFNSLTVYEVTSCSPDWLMVDRYTGAMIVKDTLDYETSNQINCTVTAYSSNQTSNKDSANVTITIKDVNDRIPTFSQVFYKGNTTENATGALVLTVKATDPDAGKDGEIRYSIVDPDDIFVINDTTGEISVSKKPDYENKTSHLITVIAEDQGTSVKNNNTVYVQITIDPVNEFTPTFNVTPCIFSVLENKTAGDVVYIVNATDLDAGLDGALEFSIDSLNNALPLRIDSGTGAIRVAYPLDYETQKMYTFNVTVKDNSTSTRLSSNMTCTANIINVNDSDIICENVPTVVLKKPAQEDTVAKLKCNDSDNGGIALVNYGLCGGNDKGEFKVDSLGKVSVNIVPTTTRYDLSVCVYDVVNLTVVSFTVLTETSLTFLNLPNTTHVVENTSGMELFHVTSCCAFPNVTYSILGGNEDNKMTFDSSTGIMGLTVPYDREIQSKYEYKVQAKSDSGQTIIQNLTVIVDDVNDNAPEFDSSVYVLKISEDYSAPNNLIQITATDKDDGLNKTLTYSLTNASTFFDIDNNGFIRLLTKLDYETQDSFELLLTARDGGSPQLSGSATVYIIVVNANEYPPEIIAVPGTLSTSLSEDVALGTLVFQVQARDNDTGTKLLYSITSGNTNDDFRIDPVSGNITTWHFLDRETTPSYNLVIVVQDQMGKNATATVSVTVTDINDNNPIFSQNVYIFAVADNATPGTFIETLNATDKDAGVNASISATLSGAHASDFSLDSSSLVLTNQAVMAYATNNYYQMTAVAQDKGTPPRSSSAVVIVTVSKSLSPKFNSSTYTVHIFENQTVGNLVIDLDATLNGLQEGINLKYSIISGNTNNDFIIRDTNGQIVIFNNLDFETTSSYSLIVHGFLTPAGNPIDTCTVSIIIDNVNDNSPIFKDSSLAYDQETFSFNVKEESPLTTAVGIVLATDKDQSPYGTVTLTLSNTTKFAIHPTSGAISVNGNLDYTEASSYKLVVTATDSGVPALTAKASVVINIIDINNHAPEFITPNNVSVLDTTAIGSEIFRFHATDKDTGDAGLVAYTDTTQNAAFELDSASGILKTKAALTPPSYALTIEAKDKDAARTMSTSQVFTVYVIFTDPNNNDPVFSPASYSVNVPRSSGSGTSVETVTATDADKGLSAQLVYTIASGNTDGYFVISQSTGLITAATSMLSAKDTYSLIVVATDQGNPPRSASATVAITVVPKMTTSITPNYIFQVYENVNGEVGRILVDKDLSPTKYTIVSGNIGSVLSIKLDATTKEGVLSASALDYETVPVYSLEVTVDSDIGSLTKIVEVQVMDVNDNPPVFAPLTITLTIPENLPVGHTVDTITATDADVTANFKIITFAIANPGHDYFNYDQSGHLTIKLSPDYETTTQDIIVLTATDQLFTSSVTVTINLLNIEEVEDVSTSSLTSNALISLEVPYQATQGHSIQTLTAGDFGINISSTANVEFISYKSDVPFSIDSTTGELTVSGSPALTNHAKYFMWILCRTKDGSVTTSQISLIRVDTFDLYSQMAVIEFAESYSEVSAKKAAFQRRAQAYFGTNQRFGISNIIDTSSSSRRKLLATNTIAYSYVVSNTGTTDNMANVNQDKTFFTEAEILTVLQDSSDGTPASGLSDPNFLDVTKVMPYQETQQGSDSEFVSSPAGIAMFCLLALLLLLALALLIACLCYRKKKRDDERRLLQEENKKSQENSGFFIVREFSDAELPPKHYDQPPPAIHSYRQTPANQPQDKNAPLLNVPEEKREAESVLEKPKDASPNIIVVTAPTETPQEIAETSKEPQAKPSEERKRVNTQRGDTNNNVSIIKSSAKTFSGTSLAASNLQLKSKSKGKAGRKQSPNSSAKDSRKPQDSATKKEVAEETKPSEEAKEDVHNKEEGSSAPDPNNPEDTADQSRDGGD